MKSLISQWWVLPSFKVCIVGFFQKIKGRTQKDKKVIKVTSISPVAAWSASCSGVDSPHERFGGS